LTRLPCSLEAQNYVQTLVGRGYLYQCTDKAGLDKLASTDKLVGYIGFDCTAPSLHVGSLVQIMMLRHLQKSGGTPIVLLGGGTTKIGDPSGKDKSRQMLTQAQINANKDGIRRVFAKFLDFEGPNAAIMVDNDDWLGQLGYLEFYRQSHGDNGNRQASFGKRTAHDISGIQLPAPTEL